MVCAWVSVILKKESLNRPTTVCILLLPALMQNKGNAHETKKEKKKRKYWNVSKFKNQKCTTPT